MVEFLSILIGLHTGTHPVELTVTAEVAAVEIRLDDRELVVLTRPPWAFECDFGPTPRPHELVAIARNARGEEIDRATRWINLADSSTAASLSLERSARGRPLAVRISWESIGVRQPRSVELLFDGEPLEVTNPRRVPLPRFDPGQIHFVSATLTFANDRVERLEASFGGTLGEEVRTELTAVAVVLDKGARLPPAAEMQGWFHKKGVPLAVHGVEKGAAEVIFVRDPTVQPQLEILANLALGLDADADRRGPESTTVAKLRRRISGRAEVDALRPLAWLGKDVTLRFLAPAAAPLPGSDLKPEMFPHSPAYGADDGGFLRISQQPERLGFPTHFADAVAIAGLAAHSTHRRRAVVALLGDLPDDRSEYAAAAVAAYLRQLHVPLAVWRFAPVPRHLEWSRARDVGVPPRARSVPERFEEAVADLRRALRRQRVVWLEGRHLPQDIELTSAAGGIRLAGGWES